MTYDIIETLMGPFLLVADRDGLNVLDYQNGPKARAIDPSWTRDPDALARAGELLSAYLGGNRPRIDISLRPQGTPFQKEVWEKLITIPYGHTVSYQDMARSMGKPKATRAVAGAIGRNPIQIFIPCHRVIGKDGHLRGYAGGLSMKQRLLDLERIIF